MSLPSYFYSSESSSWWEESLASPACLSCPNPGGSGRGSAHPRLPPGRHYLEKREDREEAGELSGEERPVPGWRRASDDSAKIGILIAMAAIIGNCLMESGGALRIVRSFLNLMVEKRPEAMAGSSFLLGIPVFSTLYFT